VDQLKVGDVVCLKSGGPDMTIESIQPLETNQSLCASCVWFDDKIIHRAVLPLTALHEALWPIAA